ncbi:MAG: restriction endonuclease subunit S [Limisphaerales bacterium]
MKPETFSLENIRLGDVLDIRDGTHDTPKYVESGIPLITSKNLTDSGLCFRDVSFISKADHDQISNRSAVENGDILYGMIGTIGKPTLVETEQIFSIKNVALFKRANGKIHNKYLRWLLDSPVINKQIVQASKGGTQKFVSLGALRGLRATFPAYPEQRRIAAILDQADALRAKRREALAQLDSLTQSIFIEMFGDPVLNTKGWPLVPLADSSERIQIGPFGSQLHEEEYIEGGIPLINPTHIHNGKIVPNWALTVSKEKYNLLSQYHLVEGDLVLGRRGEMGRCAVVTSTERGWLCGTGSLFIRPKNKVINSIYLGFVISSTSIKRYLENVAQGVTMANLNKGIVGALPIPVPPLSVQLEFVAQVTSLEKLQNTQLSFYNKLDALFASLQHRAFRGEL